MAYAAVISLQRTIENLQNSPRISLAPTSPQIMESACQQLNSLRKNLKRLDKSSKSNSRKKVNALDARIKEAVWKFEDLLESHVYNQILSQSEVLDSGGDLLQVHLQELRHDVDSMVKMLKEKEEYIYQIQTLESSVRDYP